MPKETPTHTYTASKLPPARDGRPPCACGLPYTNGRHRPSEGPVRTGYDWTEPDREETR